MRVLHVLGSLEQSSGGPLRAVLDLSAKSFDYSLHSEILGVGPLNVRDNPFPTAFIHSLPSSRLRSYGYSGMLRPWLREHLRDFDGVVIHGMWQYPTWAAAQECLRLEKPYACFPHGMLEPWPVFGQGKVKALKKMLYWKLREKSVFRNGVAALFTTQREARLARSTFSLPEVPLMVVPYGVSIRPEVVQKPGYPGLAIPDGVKVALFLGRVHPKKNVDFLVKAWAQAKPADDWRLVIAGPGEEDYLHSLKLLVGKLGLAGSVIFRGLVTGLDKAYLFQRSHWFLLPSSQENFGISVLEAIQHGCAVALSDQVYFTEFMHSGSEVLPLEMRAWVEFLSGRMGNEVRRQELLELDRRLVIPQFDINRIAKEWAERLQEIFDRRWKVSASEMKSSGLSWLGSSNSSL